MDTNLLKDISNWKTDEKGRKYHMFEVEDEAERSKIRNILLVFVKNHPRYSFFRFGKGYKIVQNV